MKKIVAMMCVMGMLIAGCGGSSTSVSAKTIGAELLKKASFDAELSKGNTKALLLELGISSKDVDEMYYRCATGQIAECIIAITSDKADDVKSELKIYKDNREKLFATYAPKEAEKLNDAEVLTKGDTTILCVSKDAAKVSKIVKNIK